MVRRASLATLVLIAAAVAPVSLVAEAGAGPRSGDPGRFVDHRIQLADRNGDRIEDHLAGQLLGASSTQRFDVIVTGVGVRAAAARVGRFPVGFRLRIIDGFSARLTAGQVRRLARDPGVRRIDAVREVHLLDDGTSRDFGVDGARLDRPALTGAGVGLCVVDTGIDQNHEQIAPRTVTFFDAINGQTTPYDDHGHGTHVMAIAAGDGSNPAYEGVAPGAALFSAKVLNSQGNGTDAQVIAGVDWCHHQGGVRVISMSLGDDAIVPDGTDPLSQAVNRANSGSDGYAPDVVVVAAGNSGDKPGSVNAPGAALGAITVGAVAEHSNPAGLNHDDGIWLAGFSSRGPTADQRVKPDISAPGVTVTSAQGGTTSGYVTYSGTSMATPFVAGAVVLGLAAVPAATPSQVRAALTGSALDVGAAGTDNEWGAGLIDVRAFVDTLAGDAVVDRTDFPQVSRFTSSVPNNGSVTVPIAVPAESLGFPLVVMTTALTGTSYCHFPWGGGCFPGYEEWLPDVDIELLAPNGTVVAESQCMLSGLTCGLGRQETVALVPTVAGTYTLRVTAFTGSPNNGQGGPFSVDVSQGPLGAGTPPPPPPPPPANNPPVANAGPDQDVKTKGKTAAIVLSGTGSDPDGDPLTYAWRDADGNLVGTTARVNLKRGVGTWTFTLTVSDGRGGTGSDSVKVVVHR